MAVALATQWRYLDAPPVLDALYYDLGLGLAEMGRATYADYVLAPHGGYPHVLWKLVYAAWRMLPGGGTVASHALILAAHVATAWGLFVLVRRATIANVGAWVAGIAWAGAAIGGYDSALLWTSNGEQALALALLVGAMVSLRGCRRRPWRTAFLTTALTFAAGLTWGILIGLLPVLYVHYWLVERDDALSRRRYWPALALMSVAITLLTAFVGMYAAAAQADDSAGQITARTTERFMAQLLAPLAHLAFFSQEGTSWTIWAGALLAAPLVAAVAAGPAPGRRLALVLASIGLAYCAIVVVFRSNRDLSDGRYFYVTTLSWTGILGLAVSAMIERWRVPRSVLIPVGAVALVAFLAGQSLVARGARRQFDGFFAATFATIDEDRALLLKLNAEGLGRGAPVRVPEFPMMIPPYFQPVYYPLATFVHLQFPGGLPGVVIVPPDEVTDADVAAFRELLSSFGGPSSAQWSRRLDIVLPELRSLGWLARFAEREQIVVTIPPLRFVHRRDLKLELPVDQCLKLAFARPPRRLRVAPVAEISPDQARDVLERLGRQRDQSARDWERVFEPLVKR